MINGKLQLDDLYPTELKVLRQKTGLTLQTVSSDLTAFNQFLTWAGMHRDDPQLPWEYTDGMTLKEINDYVDAHWTFEEEATAPLESSTTSDQ